MVVSFSLAKAFPPSVPSIHVLRLCLQALVAACLPLNFIHPKGSLSKSPSDAQAALFLMPENWALQQALPILSEKPSWDIEHPSDRLPESHVYWGGRDAAAMKHLLVPNKHPKVPGAEQSFS